MYAITENSAPKNQVLLEDKHIGAIKDGLIFCQVGKNNIEKFSKFVYDVYVESYNKRKGWEPIDGELEYMIEEDKRQFKHSYYFAFKNLDGEFVGGAKITKMIPTLKFPIETDFNYDVREYFTQKGIPTNDFWHMGRTAINKATLCDSNTQITSIQILDRLMWECYNVVAQEENNMMIGEVDAMAYRIYRVKGVQVYKMGEGIDYLGSMTYPAYIKATDLKVWMNANLPQ